MKKRLYFRYEDSEMCHDKDYFLVEMKFELIPEMDVFEAIPEKIKDVYWCREFQCVGNKLDDEPCGKQCEGYIPRNGKSGCCKYYTNTLYTSGNKATLKNNSMKHISK